MPDPIPTSWSIPVPASAEPRRTGVDPDPEAFARYVRAIRRGFHVDPDGPAFAAKGPRLEPARSFGYRVHDDWVATCLSIGTRMSVPGGWWPTAAVTYVTVAPAYRGRGLFGAMLTDQVSELADRGDVAALLWATQGGLYRRFGYGNPMPSVGLDLDLRAARLRSDVPTAPGTVAEVDQAVLRSVAPSLRTAVAATRAGALDRDELWWTYTLADPPEHRDGAAPLRYAVRLGQDGTPDGYVVFRVRRGWTDGRPSGAVEIAELETLDTAARAALWRFLLGIDLVVELRWSNAPPDEPLRWWLEDAMALRTHPWTGSWLRVLDIERALTTRSYAAELDVVIDVDDPLLAANHGRFRLRAGPEAAEVARTSAAADVTLGIAELSTLVLGGVRIGQLAAAGIVGTDDPTVLARWDAAFSTPLAPFATDHF